MEIHRNEIMICFEFEPVDFTTDDVLLNAGLTDLNSYTRT